MTEKFDIATVDNYWVQKIVREYELEPRERRERVKRESISRLIDPRLEDVIDVALLLITHPDDEVIGPGGTAARLTQAGKEVYILQYSDGETGTTKKAKLEDYRELRLAQAAEADRRLGVYPRVSLHIPTWELTPWTKIEHGNDLYEAIIAFIRYVRPDLILTHSRHDSEPAHNIVNKIATASVYKARSTSFCDDHGGIWETPFAWEFETQDGFKELGIKPEILVDVGEAAFEMKMNSMGDHVSELKKLEDIQKTMKERYEEWGKAEAYIRAERRGGDYLMPENPPLIL